MGRSSFPGAAQQIRQESNLDLQALHAMHEIVCTIGHMHCQLMPSHLISMGLPVCLCDKQQHHTYMKIHSIECLYTIHTHII